MSLKSAFFLAVLSLGAVAFYAYWHAQPGHAPAPPPPEPLADLSKVSAEDMNRLVNVNLPAHVTSREAVASIASKLKQRIERADARTHEAVLTFKTA